MTVGVGVTYYLYQSANYQGVPFEIPIIPLVVMTMCILAVCLATPITVYHNLEKKGSVAERIKGFE